MWLIDFSDATAAHAVCAVSAPGDITALRPSFDGRTVAAVVVPAAGEAQVMVLDVAGGERSWRIWAEGRRCRGIAWSPSGELAAELDEALLLGRVDGDGRELLRLPSGLSDLVWFDEETLALAFPLTSAPIQLLGRTGAAVASLSPPFHPVSTHSPKLAVAHEAGLLAFSYVWHSVAVFDRKGAAAEVMGDTQADDAPRIAITHRLAITATGDLIVTAAAPSRGDRHTDLWVGEPGRGSLARLLRLPPTAAAALSPDLTGCLASPIDDDRIGVWTAAADVREIGRRTDRLWGLATTDRRLWAWSRRVLSVFDLVRSPWG